MQGGWGDTTFFWIEKFSSCPSSQLLKKKLVGGAPPPGQALVLFVCMYVSVTTNIFKNFRPRPTVGRPKFYIFLFTFEAPHRDLCLTSHTGLLEEWPYLVSKPKKQHNLSRTCAWSGLFVDRSEVRLEFRKRGKGLTLEGGALFCVSAVRSDGDTHFRTDFDYT